MSDISLNSKMYLKIKFIIPLILFLVETTSVFQPAFAFDSKYLEPLESVMRALFIEARGRYDWEEDPTIKISGNDRVNFHRMAGVITFLWLNLNTSIPVNSRLINVINDVRAENSQADLSKDILPAATLASVFRKIKVEFDIDDEVISDSMETVGELMDSKFDPGSNDYLTTNFMDIWPYYNENSAPSPRLHLKFLHFAFERFNRRCFSVLGAVQAQARTILGLGRKLQFSEKVTCWYHKESFFIPITPKRTIPAKLSIDPPCSELPERNVDSDLFNLITSIKVDIQSDPEFQEKWNDEYFETIKNYDSDYRK